LCGAFHSLIDFSLAITPLKGATSMFRSIISVVVGYVVMAILVGLSFVPVLVAPDLVFEYGSANASLGFSIFSLIAGFVAAVAGGLVAAVVARRDSRYALPVFAGLVLIFGVASAVASVRAERPSVSADEISRMTIMERASKGKEPTWYAFMLPLVGSGGVLAGGALRRRLWTQTKVD
jgi:hypothetical protein